MPSYESCPVASPPPPSTPPRPSQRRVRPVRTRPATPELPTLLRSTTYSALRECLDDEDSCRRGVDEPVTRAFFDVLANFIEPLVRAGQRALVASRLSAETIMRSAVETRLALFESLSGNAALLARLEQLRALDSPSLASLPAQALRTFEAICADTERIRAACAQIDESLRRIATNTDSLVAAADAQRHALFERELYALATLAPSSSFERRDDTERSCSICTRSFDAENANNDFLARTRLARRCGECSGTECTGHPHYVCAPCLVELAYVASDAGRGSCASCPTCRASFCWRDIVIEQHAPDTGKRRRVACQ